MAKRLFRSSTWSAVAVADATNMVNQQFMALQGGSTTQRTLISEIEVGGQATASAPSILQTSRDSTVGATLTALTTNESDSPIDPATAALAAVLVSFTQSTTKPQRSATFGLVNQSINAFGGIARWVAYPYEELIMYGSTAVNSGEVSLSAYTGSTTASIGAHIVYETL
jgi:hypothetical protein